MFSTGKPSVKPCFGIGHAPRGVVHLSSQSYACQTMHARKAPARDQDEVAAATVRVFSSLREPDHDGSEVDGRLLTSAYPRARAGSRHGIHHLVSGSIVNEDFATTFVIYKLEMHDDHQRSSRVSKSCNTCRAGKRQCDRQRPECSRCRRLVMPPP